MYTICISSGEQDAILSTPTNPWVRQVFLVCSALYCLGYFWFIALAIGNVNFSVATALGRQFQFKLVFALTIWMQVVFAAGQLSRDSACVSAYADAALMTQECGGSMTNIVAYRLAFVITQFMPLSMMPLIEIMEHQSKALRVGSVCLFLAYCLSIRHHPVYVVCSCPADIFQCEPSVCPDYWNDCIRSDGIFTPDHSGPHGHYIMGSGGIFSWRGCVFSAEAVHLSWSLACRPQVPWDHTGRAMREARVKQEDGCAGQRA
jgi:hypothetical protein